MLNNIQSEFTINDLENLSGIKAHTIRIWEKRFNLLAPKRTDTNIRRYDIDNLRKLLNVALLYNNGHKISTLAELTDSQLLVDVNELLLAAPDKSAHISSFKLAMLNFNTHLFEETYQLLLSDKSFSDVFVDVFIPLLNEIGLLWQTNSINPAHEHFISNLIRQKLFLNIEKLSFKQNTDSRTFILFLPLGEMHELGLLFVHYKLLLLGKRSIYLGAGVPATGLDSIRQSISGSHTYITYLTTTPGDNEAKEFANQLIPVKHGAKDKLWITGPKATLMKPSNNISRVSIFNHPVEMFENL